MSELLRLAEVMNKLRSPGGCPWDAEQTHESLIKYLLEESYEFIDAVETNDRAGLQVIYCCRFISMPASLKMIRKTHLRSKM